MALQTTNARHLARYSLEIAGGMASSCGEKRIVRIVDKVNNSIASTRESPAVPLHVLKFAIFRARLCQNFGLVGS